MSNLEHAIKLAEQGFRVFPLSPNKRLPAIKEWPDHATTDVEQVKTWWSKRDPKESFKNAPPLTAKGAKCNIGIATGQGLIVIDVDIKKGKKGDQSLKRLIAEGLPQTHTVQSTSGGIHLYYKSTADSRLRNRVEWLPGLDIRGDGGFVVAPHSEINGAKYTLLSDTVAVAELPEKFLSQLLEGATTQSDNSNTASLILDNTSPYSELPDVIKCGERDDTLFKYACSFRERGYSKDHARILMGELFNRCEQRADDSFVLEDATAKLDLAWKNYKPSDKDHWTQQVTPDNKVVTAPTTQLKTIKDALSRFILSIEGSCVIDMERQPKHAVMKLEEFKNAFKNVYISNSSLPGVWLGNRNRQSVRGTLYYPEPKRLLEFDSETFYNTYTPSGQDIPSRISESKTAIFIEHINYLLGDRESTKRFLMWCAVTVQKPWVRIPWMPLIVTNPRCGKGFVFQVLQKVLGSHNTAKIGPDDLDEKRGNYNEWLSETLLVCIDEIKTTHRWDITERLKSITTEKELVINHKWGKKGQEQIFCNLIAFSNHNDAVALDKTDGRFWVINCRRNRNTDEYYKKIFAWLESDGPAHLEAWLKQLNISQFDYNAPPPSTTAKEEMIKASVGKMEQLVLDAIDDHEGPFKADIIDITLVEQFLLEQTNKTTFSNNETYQVRQILVKVSEALNQERYRVSLDGTGSGKRYRCRAVRNADEWRQASAEAISNEYKRAWLSAQGREAPPSLKEVEG